MKQSRVDLRQVYSYLPQVDPALLHNPSLACWQSVFFLSEFNRHGRDTPQSLLAHTTLSRSRLMKTGLSTVTLREKAGRQQSL